MVSYRYYDTGRHSDTSFKFRQYAAGTADTLCSRDSVHQVI